MDGRASRAGQAGKVACALACSVQLGRATRSSCVDVRACLKLFRCERPVPSFPGKYTSGSPICITLPSLADSPPLAPVLAWLCRLGVEFVKRPDDGKMKGLAFVKDPDGYWIEILNPAASGALANWQDPPAA